MTRFGKQEQANLFHVCPGRDVNQIVLVIRHERVSLSEIVKDSEYLFKIPGILEVKFVQPNLCFR